MSSGASSREGSRFAGTTSTPVDSSMSCQTVAPLPVTASASPPSVVWAGWRTAAKDTARVQTMSAPPSARAREGTWTRGLRVRMGFSTRWKVATLSTNAAAMSTR